MEKKQTQRNVIIGSAVIILILLAYFFLGRGSGNSAQDTSSADPSAQKLAETSAEIQKMLSTLNTLNDISSSISAKDFDNIPGIRSASSTEPRLHDFHREPELESSGKANPFAS